MGALMCALVALGWASERTEHRAVTNTELAVVNASDDVLVFGDGTQLRKADESRVEHLQEGVKVKLTYEERDGQHVVTSIDTVDE
jgi:hypothetical protein